MIYRPGLKLSRAKLQGKRKLLAIVHSLEWNGFKQSHFTFQVAEIL